MVCEYDRPIDQAVTWADVKANIIVKKVAAPVTSGSWKIRIHVDRVRKQGAACLLPHLRVRQSEDHQDLPEPRQRMDRAEAGRSGSKKGWIRKPYQPRASTLERRSRIGPTSPNWR